MKTASVALLAAGALLASPGACARTGVPIANFENVQIVAGSGKPIDADTVKQAITGAATAKGWTIAAVEDGKLQATNSVNGHSVTVDISYAPASYTIRYAQSLNMNYEMTGTQPAIHPTYNAWVKDLKLAIDAALKRRTGPPVRIGVAMTAVPKLTIRTPGVSANCIPCVVAAEAPLLSIKKHLDTLPSEGLAKLKAQVAELLRKNGMDPVVIVEDLDLDALPRFATRSRKTANRDFSSLKQKHGIDKLAVIEIVRVGLTRNFSAYVPYVPTSAVPTGPPKATFYGHGYIVDLSDNAYEINLPVNIATAVEYGDWDEPPKYPGMTNAYFQTLDRVREDFLQRFNSDAQ
jgi:hypothetical protein